MDHRCAMRAVIFAALGVLTAARVFATTVIPIADHELHDRADVIVHGIVVSSGVVEDVAGRPITVSVIEPLEILKGYLAGDLVLRQIGGELPDGRFLKIWGRPEYEPGHEVLVFAIERADGDYQTAELLLGKFDVQTDDVGTSFAVPAFAAKAPGVHMVRGGPSDPEGDDELGTSELTAPRELSGFLHFLRRPGSTGFTSSVAPGGELSAIVHLEHVDPGPRPLWGNIGGGLWRWNNGATAVWKLEGQANIAGGGTAEAVRAAATWTNAPDTAVNYAVGAGTSNVMHLNALSSPCGWSTCLAGGGVIGCGGPRGGGTNLWRGETYATITAGEVWLRSYCNATGFDSTTTEAVLIHELGHTLGLGHSDQNVSPHDLCRGDENVAQMRSVVQHRTTLGTDDADALRWLYGDGGNSCSGPSLTVTKAGSGSGTVSSTPGGILCGKTCFAFFADGAVATLSAVPSADSVFAGWSGDPDCANGSVTMNASKTCTATFETLPDLVVTALSVPATGGAGLPISVGATVKNQGGGSTPMATTVSFYLSTNATLGAGDVLLASLPVGVLGPNATSPVSTTSNIPAGTAPGTYYVIASADDGGVVSEVRELNNTKAARIKLSPDLVIASLKLDVTTIVAGGTVAITETTKNEGKGSAAETTTRYYLSANTTFDGSDVPLGSRGIGILLSEESSEGTASVRIPAGTPPGKYYVLGLADADKRVAESKEGNNMASTVLTIGP